MGSGDVNYGIIDLEVERDPVLGEPTMNASGVKGALRDHCKKNTENRQDIIDIFGSEGTGDQQGQYNFFSGDLLARPVRVSGGNGTYALATTPELLRHFQRKLKAFGYRDPFSAEIPVIPEGQVFSGKNYTEVEGIPVQAVQNVAFSAELNQLLGTDNWVLMNPRQLADIDLPVLAHNVLEDGISKNLWHEQVVPHESIFGLVIQAPDGDSRLDQILSKRPVVQFGAGASTGCGFTQLEKVEG